LTGASWKSEGMASPFVTPLFTSLRGLPFRVHDALQSAAAAGHVNQVIREWRLHDWGILEVWRIGITVCHTFVHRSLRGLPFRVHDALQGAAAAGHVNQSQKITR
jgi:hypothetical protein